MVRRVSKLTTWLVAQKQWHERHSNTEKKPAHPLILDPLSLEANVSIQCASHNSVMAAHLAWRLCNRIREFMSDGSSMSAVPLADLIELRSIGKVSDGIRCMGLPRERGVENAWPYNAGEELKGVLDCTPVPKCLEMPSRCGTSAGRVMENSNTFSNPDRAKMRSETIVAAHGIQCPRNACHRTMAIGNTCHAIIQQSIPKCLICQQLTVHV